MQGSPARSPHLHCQPLNEGWEGVDPGCSPSITQHIACTWAALGWPCLPPGAPSLLQGQASALPLQLCYEDGAWHNRHTVVPVLVGLGLYSKAELLCSLLNCCPFITFYLAFYSTTESQNTWRYSQHVLRRAGVVCLIGTDQSPSDPPDSHLFHWLCLQNNTFILTLPEREFLCSLHKCETQGSSLCWHWFGAVMLITLFNCCF